MSQSRFSFTRSNGTTITLEAKPPVLTLSYAVPAGPRVLTDNLNSFAFKYFQVDGTTIATGKSDVAIVELDIELSYISRVYQQRTRVALRNR